MQAMFTRIVTASLLTALLPLKAMAQAPAETLDAAMTRLASNVQEYLNEKKETVISVGKFQGPPGLPNSNGLAIQKSLQAKLSGMGLKTDVGGRGIRGSYKVSTANAAQPTVLIMATMITRNGDEDLTFVSKFQGEAEAADNKAVVQKVTNEEDVNKVLGTTNDLTTNVPTGPKAKAEAFEERAKRVAESIENPSVSIQPSKGQPAVTNAVDPDAAGPKVGPPAAGAPPVNSVVSPTAASPHRIEVLVRNKLTGQFEPRAAENKGGLAFTTLGLADEYAVRIINDADYDVGVKLTIDSLSMFEFSKIEPYRKLQMVWIGAHSSGVITGWHIDNFQTQAFEIDALPKSAAFQKGCQEGDIGTISAQFFASWVGPKPPDVELRGQGRAGNENLVGTKIGRAVEQKYGEKVAQFGVSLLATVTIRYQVPEDLPPLN